MNNLPDGVELTSEQENLYKELEKIFLQAGITDVGGRLGVLFHNDEALGKFLKANSNLSFDQLSYLYEALGEPEPIYDKPQIDVDEILSQQVFGNGSGHSGGSGGVETN